MIRFVTTFGAIAAAMIAGCAVDDPDYEETQRALSCSPHAYTPYDADGGRYPSGTVAHYPWRGPVKTYPSGVEDFRGYGTSLPKTIECGDTKHARAHLDVTAGCLSVVTTGNGEYTRGQIQPIPDGSFRAIARGFVAGDDEHSVKWTDQAVEYRFYYTAQHGNENNPGFKAFVRYRTEDDLYVASWRTDGVVQIQRKQCGEYTALAVDQNYGAPKKGVWHWIRFEAEGTKLRLYIDHELALTATTSTFSWGTAGIRIDAMDGAYLDDWRVFSP
ncbi:MAG: hypothetical protein AB7O24_01260 [Kofleriaceae bacterium]